MVKKSNSVGTGIGIVAGIVGFFFIWKNGKTIVSKGKVEAAKYAQWLQGLSMKPGPTQSEAEVKKASVVLESAKVEVIATAPPTSPQLQNAAQNPNANVRNTSLVPQFTVIEPVQIQWYGGSQKYTSPQGGDIVVHVVNGVYDIFATGRYNDSTKVAIATCLNKGYKGEIRVEYNLGTVSFWPKGSGAPSWNLALDAGSNIWLPPSHPQKKSFGSL